jgi:hypothetical protein
LFQQSITALWEWPADTAAERPGRVPDWAQVPGLEFARLVNIKTIVLPTHELQELLSRDGAVLVGVHHLMQNSHMPIDFRLREGCSRNCADNQRRDHGGRSASHDRFSPHTFDVRPPSPLKRIDLKYNYKHDMQLSSQLAPDHESSCFSDVR